MKRIGFALIVSALVCASSVSATEYDDGKLIPRGETAAVSDGKGASLQAMLSRIAQPDPASPTDLEYSLQWVDSQPKATGEAEFKCLSEALYFEARGEAVRGQFAVAEVIMNRAKSSLYPDTICRVISQGASSGRRYQCQFTYRCDGYKDRISERQAYERVKKVARAALDGYSGNLTDGALYYHTRAVRPSWSRRFIRTASIGVHYFYRRPDQRASSE